jgi:hypothetical protein
VFLVYFCSVFVLLKKHFLVLPLEFRNVLVHRLLIVVEVSNTVVLSILIDFFLKNFHFEVHKMDLLLQIEHHFVLVIRNGVGIVTEHGVAGARLVHSGGSVFLLASSEHIAH